MLVNEFLNLENISNLLMQKNSVEDLVLFILIEVLVWLVISFLLIQFLPKKYIQYKKEIFIFFVVLNIGLLFIGILLTLIMMLFGLSWATHRLSRPDYETIHFEEQVSEFPIVYSQFQEGLLMMEGHQQASLSSDQKIKSLKILYENNSQGNIAKIKLFLSDSSDETRLYAFALASSFEKNLNDRIKSLQDKIQELSEPKELEEMIFTLAQTYWQFIFHGVVTGQLTGFYTKKIATLLKASQHNPSSFILLGKIHLFNGALEEAEKAFLKAIELGIPKQALYTFLAEIKYGQKKYDEISQYIIEDEFNIDLRLKPLVQMWSEK
ncbi:MAG: Extracellular Matrix protein PelE [uncultured Sulfurovum sp.]|uniref:Extracellular Matrix protein PelE n=1 Tax=uncultured Sulfurovum sp. TaxID=269237 RepID=A0A6S6TII7_9BACT|nr:MAG: Extracellular Matrix protein PelE [uncultured Sulfurovum sp.]